MARPWRGRRGGCETYLGQAVQFFVVLCVFCHARVVAACHEQAHRRRRVGAVQLGQRLDGQVDVLLAFIAVDGEEHDWLGVWR